MPQDRHPATTVPTVEYSLIHSGAMGAAALAAPPYRGP
jgi:hypothetical protein